MIILFGVFPQAIVGRKIHFFGHRRSRVRQMVGPLSISRKKAHHLQPSKTLNRAMGKLPDVKTCTAASHQALRDATRLVLPAVIGTTAQSRIETCDSLAGEVDLFSDGLGQSLACLVGAGAR